MLKIQQFILFDVCRYFRGWNKCKKISKNFEIGVEIFPSLDIQKNGFQVAKRISARVHDIEADYNLVAWFMLKKIGEMPKLGRHFLIRITMMNSPAQQGYEDH